MDYEQITLAFLAVAPQFRLGGLVTEQPHPLTANLSTLAGHDLIRAITVLHRADTEALDRLEAANEKIPALMVRIAQTLESGRSIFLCGCGSTGRLSLACEALWRAAHRADGLQDRVRAFMAGGDVALVRSIENFEDHPEYGARHLEEMGFTDGDLLIAVTEGGETPFVIGATMRAAAISSNRPFFLYCNPDDFLCAAAERSAAVIRDPRIEKINCTVGPMALAGSTRMQASTALMAVVGLALEWYGRPDRATGALRALCDTWAGIDPLFLEKFIVLESSRYRNGDYLLYATDRNLAITVLTDTTERAPTFGMRPFESVQDTAGEPSPCYVYLPDAPDADTAWEHILNRQPRMLHWQGTAAGHLQKHYDFSAALPARRALAGTRGTHHTFAIRKDGDAIEFSLENASYRLPVGGMPPLPMHCILKMLLNIHSTLVMGRLGRYEGNIMTWVRPSNNKLIDRAVRYIGLLLKQKGIDAPYEKIALACFKVMERVGPGQSVVHETVEEMSGGGR